MEDLAKIEFEKEFEKYISKMVDGDVKYLEDSKKKLRDLGKACNIPFEGKVHELFVNAASQLNAMRKTFRWGDSYANSYERLIEHAKGLLPKEMGYKIPDKSKIKELYKQKNYVK